MKKYRIKNISLVVMTAIISVIGTITVNALTNDALSNTFKIAFNVGDNKVEVDAKKDDDSIIHFKYNDKDYEFYDDNGKLILKEIIEDVDGTGMPGLVFEISENEDKVLEIKEVPIEENND